VNLKKDIIGQRIQFNDKTYTVIGVIKDMIMESPYKPVRPTIFFYEPNWVNEVIVGVKPGQSVKDALAKIEAVFKNTTQAHLCLILSTMKIMPRNLLMNNA
jgi:hypothetical protein